jgi:hypothetical protein
MSGLIKRMLKKTAPYVGAGMLFFSTTALGQQITGRVIEEGTNKGLQGQNIEIYINSDKTPINTTTGLDGSFDKVTAVENENNINAQDQLQYKYNGNQLIINLEGKITIYDILGRELLKKNIEKNKPITISNLASGVYITKIETPDGKNYVNKISYDKTIKGIGQTTQKLETKQTQSLSKIASTTLDSILVSSPTTQEIPQAENKTIIDGKTYDTSTIDLGDIQVSGKNIVNLNLYDVESGLGINAQVFLSSTPIKKYETNNGIITFNTTENDNDTLEILSNEYYNIKHPFTFNIGNNNIKGLNDSNGLLDVKRYTDTTAIEPILINGTWTFEKRNVDQIEFLQYITDIKNAVDETDHTFDKTNPSFKSPNIYVWMNRGTAPSNAYADSLMAGMHGLETGPVKFIETTDSAQAQIHVDYNNINVGSGKNIQYSRDSQGFFLTNWDISFSNNMPSSVISSVAAHEALRALYNNAGQQSSYINYVSYQDAISHYGYTNSSLPSKLENDITKLFFTAPRNTKWGEYK